MTINHVIAFDPKQFAALCAAIERRESMAGIQTMLSLIRKELKTMALDLSGLLAAVADVQADVQNVIRKLNEPDVDAQAKIDAATESLRAVNAALDAVAPDPAPVADAPVADEPTV